MRAFVLFLLLWLVAGLAPAEARNAGIHLFGYDRRAGAVVLYADGPLGVRAFHLNSPERWVIDVPEARYGGATQVLPPIPGTSIRSVRIAQFKGGVVRVVFDLTERQEFPYALESQGNGSYRLVFRVGTAEATPEPPRPTPRPTPRILATVRELPSPQPTLRPAATPTLRPAATPTLRPAATPTLRPAATPTVRPAATPSLRPTARPTLAPTVRPTMRPVPTPHPTPRPRPQPSATPGLSLHRIGGTWELSVSLPGPFGYVAPPRGRSDRLTFDLQASGDELPRDSLYVDNGLIARVRVVSVSRRAARLIMEFDQPVRFQVAQTAGGRTLRIALSRAGDEPVLARTDDRRRVTIDPGHGGVDPGTLGSAGTLEKDVTLQMALRLQRLMIASGMEVQMTRTKDMQILLHPRVDVGDAFDSDVFISIHANHVDDPRISGIETYYFTPRSLSLARAVHKRMISTLRRPDRGVRRNNFVVVKYNKMPACLVEVGYLSNPTEERLLNTAAYQQRAAEAILAGVQDYFKTRALRQ